MGAPRFRDDAAVESPLLLGLRVAVVAVRFAAMPVLLADAVAKLKELSQRSGPCCEGRHEKYARCRKPPSLRCPGLDFGTAKW